MIVVKDINRKIVGYIMNNVYVTSREMKHIAKEIVLDSSVSELLDFNKSYLHLVNTVVLSNYLQFLEILTEEGVVLNDIVFLPCLKITDTRVSEFWRYTRNLNNYMCIDSYNFNIVAYLATSKSLYNFDIVDIKMIEVVNGGMHYGSRVVSQLKVLGKELNGFALVTAYDFWKKQGAVFNNGFYFSL